MILNILVKAFLRFADKQNLRLLSHFEAEAFFTYLIRFSSSCNIKCVDCKIDKNLTEFSLTHTTSYNIIKTNIQFIKEVT